MVVVVVVVPFSTQAVCDYRLPIGFTTKIRLKVDPNISQYVIRTVINFTNSNLYPTNGVKQNEDRCPYADKRLHQSSSTSINDNVLKYITLRSFFITEEGVLFELKCLTSVFILNVTCLERILGGYLSNSELRVSKK